MMTVTGYTSNVLDWRRVAVANFFAHRHCKMDDMLDPCSS